MKTINECIKLLPDFEENIQSMSTEDSYNTCQLLRLDDVVTYFIDNNINDKYCVSIVKILQYIYNNLDFDIVSNDKYDRLYALCIQDNDDIVGSKIVSDKLKRKHKYPDLRGTLDKVHFFKNDEKQDGDKRKSVQDWINSIQRVAKATGVELIPSDFDIEIYPKYDGVSSIFECDESHRVVAALTRGDTEKNEAVDITRLFNGCRFDDLEYCKDSEIGIKTELVISNDDFIKLSKIETFKSQRSAISSITNSEEVNTNLLKYITIVRLRVQDKNTGDIEIINDYDGYCKKSNLLKLDEIKNISYELFNDVSQDLPIDGVVICLTSQKMKSMLGRKDSINKYEIAFKFPAVSKVTNIKDILFSVGNLGSITPVAIFEPIVLCGNTTTNASLGSIERCQSLQLCRGDDVNILYEITPYLDKVVKRNGGEPIEIPTACPYCGHKLVHTPLLSCVNKECPAVILGKLIHFITKMRIKFISKKTLSKLLDKGIINNIVDIFRLEEHKMEIIQIEGLGLKTFNKIQKSINSRKNVYMYDLLGALGIASIGSRIFKKICNKYNIDNMESIYKYLTDSKYLLSIEGIQETTANKIIQGINDNIDILNELLKYAIIKKDTSNIMDEDIKGKVCFHQIRDKEFEKYLWDNFKIKSVSFSKSIDTLIIRNKESDNEIIDSKKIQKADKWGINIMHIDEAYRQYNFK